MGEFGSEHIEGGGPEPSPPATFVSHFLAERRSIFEYILALLPNPADAEDVLQETSTVLWQRFAEFTPGTSFIAWARQVAYYKVCEYRRQSRRQAVVLDDGILELVAAEFVAEDPFVESRRSALRQCLEKLPHNDHQLFERRYLGRSRGKDLAKELGRSADSVYKSLGRIRRTLLECIRRTLARVDRDGEEQ
jgi:RNA polymerase sigma-70 factor (ECF subfamily)